MPARINRSSTWISIRGVYRPEFSGGKMRGNRFTGKKMIPEFYRLFIVPRTSR